MPWRNNHEEKNSGKSEQSTFRICLPWKSKSGKSSNASKQDGNGTDLVTPNEPSSSDPESENDYDEIIESLEKRRQKAIEESNEHRKQNFKTEKEILGAIIEGQKMLAPMVYEKGVMDAMLYMNRKYEICDGVCLVLTSSDCTIKDKLKAFWKSYRFQPISCRIRDHAGLEDSVKRFSSKTCLVLHLVSHGKDSSTQGREESLMTTVTRCMEAFEEKFKFIVVQSDSNLLDGLNLDSFKNYMKIWSRNPEFHEILERKIRQHSHNTSLQDIVKAITNEEEDFNVRTDLTEPVFLPQETREKAPMQIEGGNSQPCTSSGGNSDVDKSDAVSDNAETKPDELPEMSPRNVNEEDPTTAKLAKNDGEVENDIQPRDAISTSNKTASNQETQVKEQHQQPSDNLTNKSVVLPQETREEAPMQLEGENSQPCTSSGGDSDADKPDAVSDNAVTKPDELPEMSPTNVNEEDPTTAQLAKNDGEVEDDSQPCDAISTSNKTASNQETQATEQHQEPDDNLTNKSDEPTSSDAKNEEKSCFSKQNVAHDVPEQTQELTHEDDDVASNAVQTLNSAGLPEQQTMENEENPKSKNAENENKSCSGKPDVASDVPEQTQEFTPGEDVVASTSVQAHNSAGLPEKHETKEDKGEQSLTKENDWTVSDIEEQDSKDKPTSAEQGKHEQNTGNKQAENHQREDDNARAQFHAGTSV